MRQLRVILGLDGMVFLLAALLNLGLRIPIGVATVAFSPSVWQAGGGQAVVGSSLLALATRARRLRPATG